MSERQDIYRDIEQIHAQLKDLSERLMKLQPAFSEPRTSVLDALDRLNQAKNGVRHGGIYE